MTDTSLDELGPVDYLVVEFPGTAEAAGPPSMAVASSLVGAQARIGIAALLAEAEDSESILNRREPAARVSTASESFVRLLEDLAANTAPDGALPREA